MTQDEYDALPYRYAYPMPSVTATVFAFHPFKGLLVGIRADHVEAFPGHTCIPGGFLEAKWKGRFGPAPRPGETIEQTALREVKEETNADIGIWSLKLFHVHSDPETDPRGHVINVCYVVMLEDHHLETLRPGDDLKALDWMDAGRLRHGSADWAFNHKDLAMIALEWVSERVL